MGLSFENAVLVFVVVVLLISHVRNLVRPQIWRRRLAHHNGWGRDRSQLARPALNGTVDAGQQLNAVMCAAFTKKRLMSPAEYRVFRLIENDLAAAGVGHRIFAQICLGEILGSKDSAAFSAINSKRVDMLVVDSYGWPVLAIEYQGEGHHQGNAAARDATKKEALRRADVRYLEVTPTDSDAQIRYHVRDLLGLGASAPVSNDRVATA